MTSPYAIADVASLVGEPTRAAILLALLDGCALPAGELAREACGHPESGLKPASRAEVVQRSSA